MSILLTPMEQMVNALKARLSALNAERISNDIKMELTREHLSQAEDLLSRETKQRDVARAS